MDGEEERIRESEKDEVEGTKGETVITVYAENFEESWMRMDERKEKEKEKRR